METGCKSSLVDDVGGLLRGGVWRPDVRAHWLMTSGACCGGSVET